MTITGKLIESVNISPGTVLHLTFEQADARAHQLKALKHAHEGRTDTRRLPFSSEQVLFFKRGEELEVEGVLERQLQAALDLSDDDLVKAKAAKPGVVTAVSAARKGAITKARNRLQAAEVAVAAAEQKLATADAGKKDKAQKAVDAAKDAAAAAAEALARAETAADA